MSSSNTTTDQDTIKNWAEAHDGVPARIVDTEKDGGEGGVIRIHFPEASDNDDNFEEIEWEEWFEIFEDSKLSFLYSEDDESTFNKLVSR